MLDIKFLRQNPDVVKENIKKKFQDEKLPLVDEVIELDKRNRAWLMAKKRKQKSLRKKFRKTLPVWKNFLQKKKKLKQKSKKI